MSSPSISPSPYLTDHEVMTTNVTCNAIHVINLHRHKTCVICYGIQKYEKNVWKIKYNICIKITKVDVYWEKQIKLESRDKGENVDSCRSQ